MVLFRKSLKMLNDQNSSTWGRREGVIVIFFYLCLWVCFMFAFYKLNAVVMLFTVVP